MARVDVPPTKSNLRRIRTDLAFAREGFDLLDQKREILVIEIMKYVRRIRGVEADMMSALDSLYAAYRIAAMEMGSDVIAGKSLSEKEVYGLDLGVSRFIGISIPALTITGRGIGIHASLYGTTAMYDRCKAGCAAALARIADYANIMKSILVLSRELKKVQRRVNALEKIFIPRNEEAVKYISDRLEEMEREEIFVKKLIRQREP